MPRPTKEEIDEEIVDQAATLFARHGYKETSVQRIADATGYSKTGLLHRFPSKEALWEAVASYCTSAVRDVGTRAGTLPPGPERDRVVLTELTDVALRRPGVIALVLSAFSRMGEPGDSALLDDVGELLFAAFSGLPPVSSFAPGCAPAGAPVELGRIARVVGALGALAVTALALRDQPGHEVREHLVAVSYDALGHPRPATP